MNNPRCRLGSAVLLVLLGASCATTHQSRIAKTSGFLKDYSLLRKGGDHEPQLIYFNSAADIRDYDKILIDPIVAYMDERAMDEGARSDLQVLLNYFHATLREQLGKDYELAMDVVGVDVGDDEQFHPVGLPRQGPDPPLQLGHEGRDGLLRSAVHEHVVGLATALPVRQPQGVAPLGGQHLDPEHLTPSSPRRRRR